MDTKKIKALFDCELEDISDVFIISEDSDLENQNQTNAIFSEKWIKYSREEIKQQEALFKFQKAWYLDLYSFDSEDALKEYLQEQDIVLDAGCGLGYKAKWFADLSPETLVLGMDYSDSVFAAGKIYKGTENLKFIKGDIANTRLKDSTISYVSCDQVIHHTEDPEKTMEEFSRILKKDSELAFYVYAKKALPRELLDEHFREVTKTIASDEMWEMSEQLTELGKTLSELDIEIDVPDIPLLGIKGGKMDVQRFVYWNFIKCFWNEDLGLETSISTNFDWYAPSNAKRYSLEEFIEMTTKANLAQNYIHSEEACYSGRFKKL